MRFDTRDGWTSLTEMPGFFPWKMLGYTKESLYSKAANENNLKLFFNEEYFMWKTFKHTT